MDCFAFYSSICNEELFADTKLHRRTSVAHVVTWRLFNYKRHDGIDPHTLLDYFSGFSTINNRCPFESDIWEGEKQFGHVYQLRGTQHYTAIIRADEDTLTGAIITPALEYGRHGNCRITKLFNATGWDVGKDLIIVMCI